MASGSILEIQVVPTDNYPYQWFLAIDGKKINGLDLLKGARVVVDSGPHNLQLLVSNRVLTLLFGRMVVGPPVPSEELTFDAAAGVTKRIVIRPRLTHPPRKGWTLQQEFDAETNSSARHHDPSRQSSNDSALTASEHTREGLVATVGSAPGASSVLPFAAAAVIEVIETHRTSEPIGEDPHTVNNSGSTSPVTRTFTVSQVWRRAWSVDYERARTLRGSAGLRALGADVRGDIESTLNRKYGTEGSTERSKQAQVEYTVAPRTKMEVVVAWRRIWQHGTVRLSASDGTVTEVPFRVVDGVDFDLEQREVG